MFGKKLIALLLSLILVLSLVACGNSTTVESPDILSGNTDETPVIPETPDTPDAPAAPEEPEVLEPWDGDYENAPSQRPRTGRSPPERIAGKDRSAD